MANGSADEGGEKATDESEEGGEKATDEVVADEKVIDEVVAGGEKIMMDESDVMESKAAVDVPYVL